MFFIFIFWIAVFSQSICEITVEVGVKIEKEKYTAKSEGDGMTLDPQDDKPTRPHSSGSKKHRDFRCFCHPHELKVFLRLNKKKICHTPWSHHHYCKV
jgi:hypothetical protein